MSDVVLIEGECVEVMRGMADASVDAVVTDPPAGIAFMSREWDSDKGGRDAWIAWLASVMRECLRLLKPGGHALVWALPRTSHWTATAIDDAGFEVRDVITHLFGSGFPKALDVSRAIDKAAGAEREVVGPARWASNHPNPRGATVGQNYGDDLNPARPATAPATDAARQWDGWGTALKPASEHWILARKPLDGTVAATVLKHGAGALNIDGCRVATGDDLNGGAYSGGARPTSAMGCTGEAGGTSSILEAGGGRLDPSDYRQPAGRFPSNVLLSHVAPAPDGTGGCVRVGTRRVKGGNAASRGIGGGDFLRGIRRVVQHDGVVLGYADADSMETVDAWTCAPGCPVAELDRQSGERTSGTVVTRRDTVAGHQGAVYGAESRGSEPVEWYGDTGGASRFFPQFAPGPLDDVTPFYYCAKAATAERNEGLSPGTRSTHPTVKPVDLMRWLHRLVCPPNGVILDPFAGSGTGGVAAALDGLRWIGIEREAKYASIARGRINAVAPLFARRSPP